MERRRDIGRLQDEIEELFEELWQVPRFARMRRGFRPDVDCFVTQDPAAVTIVVELAGADPDTIEIAALARALAISGERRRPRVGGAVYQQMEIEYGHFERQIRLPADVDVEQATATYRLGLLTIVLPLSERPRTAVNVPIKVRTAP